MKWNKLTVRELTKEEQEEYGYETLWDGPLPELDEEVLVTTLYLLESLLIHTLIRG